MGIEGQRLDSHIHLPALDGVRGMAVLMVIFWHTKQGEYGWHWENAFHFGAAGVELFFVLSGFLITGILLDTRDRPGYFRNFYARRALRIFPLYYLFLAGVLIVGRVVLPLMAQPAAQRVAEIEAGVSAWPYLLYVQNYNHLFGTGYSFLLGHTWSLAVEEQFYLCWPLFVYLVGRRGVVWTAPVLFAGSAMARWAAGPELLTDGWVFTSVCRLDGLAAGAFLAAVGRGPRGLAPFVGPGRVVGFAAAVGLAAAMGTRFAWRTENVFGYTAANLAFVGLVVCCVAPGAGAVRRLFEWRPLVACGRVSYAMYLVHNLVRDGLTHTAFPRGRSRLGSAALDQAAFTLVVAAGSFLVAWVSWHLLEKRVLSLKRYFGPPSAGGPAPRAG